MKIFGIFILLLSIMVNAQQKKAEAPRTPQKVIDLIKKQVTCKWEEKTVDTFKAGDPECALKGIAVCMFADIYVMKRAVEQGCNLIITHEPVFYNHTDDTGFLKDDKVYNEKAKFINENGLVIWRFHDHWHKTTPDGIYYGMVRKLGWENYKTDENMEKFILPETTLGKLSNDISGKLAIGTIRIIGSPDMKATKIGFLAGAAGSKAQIEMLNNDNIEILVAGEVPEWETYMYAKDAVALGMKKGAIFLGHIKSEEEGMAYCAEWLKSFIPDIQINFIPNQPNFVVK